MSGFAFSSPKSKTPAKKQPAAPKEKVGVQVALSGIISLALPYMTPRAAEIRDYVKTKMLNAIGQRIFFYHPDDDSWTNVHLKSTNEQPLLSTPPIEAVEKAVAVINRCPAVSDVTILDEDGNKLTVAQVKEMTFIPLEEQAEFAVEDEDDASDELAEAVLALQDLTAAQRTALEALRSQTVAKVDEGIAASVSAIDRIRSNEIFPLAAKLARAENEIQTLKNEVKKVLAAKPAPAPGAEEEDEAATAPAEASKPADEPKTVSERARKPAQRFDPQAAAAQPQLASATAAKAAKPASRLAAAKKRRLAAAGASADDAPEPEPTLATPAKSARSA